MERLELPETGQAFHAGHAVVAANIWERASIDDPGGPAALRAQIVVDEDRPVEVVEGDEVAIGDERWRVGEIVEDPVNRRGRVVLERSGPMAG
jgi:Family of unknown function (DUF6406)